MTKLTVTEAATLRIIRDGLAFSNVRATTMVSLLDRGLIVYLDEFRGYEITGEGRKAL